MNGKNLFSIGEMAKSVGITRKTILNYEKKGLVKPDKKDGVTGNRYYTIDTFTQIRTIRTFQKLGLSLDEIHEYFNNSCDLNPIISRIERMRDELNLIIDKLKERTCDKNNVVKEITIEPQTVYCRVYNSVSIEDKTNLLRNTAIEAMKAHGTDVTRRMYFTEYSEEAPEQISYCVAVPPESEGENILRSPMLRAICLFHHGAYEDIPKARERLVLYAKEHDLKLAGIFRNLYLEGPPQHKDKSRFVTQVIAMIE